MNEIRLFSIKRTIIFSLVLAFVSILVVGQALNGDNFIQEDDKMNTSDSQTSSTPTTTQVTSTTSGTDPQTVTETEPEAQTITITTAEDADFGSTQTEELKSVEDAAKFNAPNLATAGKNIQGFFEFSFQYLLISSIIFSAMAAFYLLLFNNNQLKEYINQSLSQAGFKTIVGSFGKKWDISTKGESFSMKIQGFMQLRLKIDLPKTVGLDPLEFGLRRSENFASTICDLEVLPLRLQIVKLYLSALANK